MKKITFRVSARTARLIGRENVATSKGAIIELVKNCYDADSPYCLLSFNDDVLYIVDTGDGMTQEVILNHWMTIGTDNKASSSESRKGRIKTGAKGIGRFALDRLGEQCEMTTFFDRDCLKDLDEQGNETGNLGYRWRVNWNDFEDESKPLEVIDASLEEIKDITFGTALKSLPLSGTLLFDMETRKTQAKYPAAKSLRTGAGGERQTP